MEDTCRPNSCNWLKLIGGLPEDCPNYVSTTWENEKKETKHINDCAPKRTFYMIRDLTVSNIALRKTNEQLRNKNDELTTNFKKVILTLAKASNRELPNGHS